MTNGPRCEYLPFFTSQFFIRFIPLALHPSLLWLHIKRDHLSLDICGQFGRQQIVQCFERLLHFRVLWFWYRDKLRLIRPPPQDDGQLTS